jgi:hypothetical protein
MSKRRLTPPLPKRKLKQPRLSNLTLERKAYLLENGPLLFHLICHHGIRSQITAINEWKWYGCYYSIFFSRQQDAMTRSIFRQPFFHVELAHLKWRQLEHECPEMANYSSSKGEPMLMQYVFMGKIKEMKP